MNTAKTTILQKLFEPRDIAILVYFRIIFGAVMLWEVFRYFEHDWISRYWIDPIFHFTYYGFDWVKPWPGDLMYVHFAAMGVLSVCIMVGFKYRICAILFFLAFSQIFFSEQSRYLNHFYLIWLVSFILIFIPANRALSIDSWFNKKIRTNFVSAYSLWLLRILVGIPYFFGGVAKLNPDWLAGYPLRFWLESEADTFPLLGQFFTEEWFVMFFAYSALFVDLLAVPFLLWRRSRIFAYAILVTFHLLNAQLFSIGIFPWFMIFATLIFFDAGWPRVFKRFKVSKKPKSKITTLSKNQKIVLSLILIFLVVQIALPLRHYAYPGNVSWTEEGHNFAWHMKLRDKDTVLMEFTATDPSTGRSWTVDHDEDLTARQESKMSTRPDMILQYSHFLAEKYRDQGHENIEIRVDITSSVNGRDYQKLIYSDVDLAKEPRTLLPKSWIVPLQD